MDENNKNQIKIHNVVISANLFINLELEKIAKNFDRAEYEPEVFPGLIYRTIEPKANYLIFSTGKIICSGTKSFELGHNAIIDLMKSLEKIGYKFTTKPKEGVVNIVASGTLNKELILDHIAFALDGCEYEPESFPGLILRLNEPHVVFLLFNSGKIVCTGARSNEEIKLAVKNLEEKLEKNKL
ncbi:MAG: TATA-box-binding protein [Candidatus Aenigmarchaeota archaeon ex4484_52]|nr:MAG: TATA-box-binding protein [Candidatus Aenigmarchaeota archaeon ex4484_52]